MFLGQQLEQLRLPKASLFSCLPTAPQTSQPLHILETQSIVQGGTQTKHWHKVAHGGAATRTIPALHMKRWVYMEKAPHCKADLPQGSSQLTWLGWAMSWVFSSVTCLPVCPDPGQVGRNTACENTRHRKALCYKRYSIFSPYGCK